MRAKVFFLILVGLQLGKGLELLPCKDGTLEIPAGQQVNVTCSGTEEMEWRVKVYDNASSYVIASLDTGRITVINDFNKSFVVSSLGPVRTSLVINPNSSFVNGTLQCVDKVGEQRESQSCELNYVYPPQRVDCTAQATWWDVDVMCNVTSAYSSRRIYKCQLIRQKLKAPNAGFHEDPATVDMEIKSTSEFVSQGEAKVSGYCRINTKFPEENGEYAFFVRVSPGTETLKANFSVNSPSELRVEKPPVPKVTCFPKTNLTINANVICTCKTTGLGQPLGSLSWMVNNELVRPVKCIVDKQGELSYTETFKLMNPGATEFRCDVMWGTTSIKGENYTFSVPGVASVALNTKSTGVAAAGVVFAIGLVIILGMW